MSDHRRDYFHRRTPCFVSTTILIAVAMIAVTIARRWQLCAVELRHRAAGLSNFTSESAEKDWFRTRARSETILITFCAIAIAATISIGLLSGGLVVLAMPSWECSGRPPYGRSGAGSAGTGSSCSRAAAAGPITPQGPGQSRQKPEHVQVRAQFARVAGSAIVGRFGSGRQLGSTI